MYTIGRFTKSDKGLIHGRISGLVIGTVPVMFDPNKNKEGNQPDCDLVAIPHNGDRYVIGKVWAPKEGQKYHFIIIESPFLNAPPLKTTLFPDRNHQDKYNLVWYSPDEDMAKAEAKAEDELYNDEAETEATAGIGEQQSRSRRYMGMDATP